MARTVDALRVTTQGPLYPPSEILDAHGDFVVIGRLPNNGGAMPWAGAIVSAQTPVPVFGQLSPYQVIRPIDLDAPGELANAVLYTLPLPLPANNYPMLFAPEQRPDALFQRRPSYPLHEAPVPDARPGDGRRERAPITLGDWIQARGQVTVTVADDARTALFEFELEHLVPDSLYTVMALRQRDLHPERPTRPGPLGIPNVLITDRHGAATFWARLPDPFPDSALPGANRVTNLVVLYMSSQMSHGGAIGLYGLGGDIHAHLKFPDPMFASLRTRA
jgi:hypothetical protein